MIFALGVLPWNIIVNFTAKAIIDAKGEGEGGGGEAEPLKGEVELGEVTSPKLEGKAASTDLASYEAAPTAEAL